jgi:hypothetical protein
MRKIVVAVLALALLSSCGVSQPKTSVLKGIKDESAMGAITSKAQKALNDIYTFSANQVSKGVPLDKITLDMLNENLRDSSVISGKDAPKYYGGLPNIASVVTGKEILASASGSDDICLYVRITSSGNGIESVHGVARDSFCRASEPITTILWAEKNSSSWPDGTATKLPTLAEYQAYDKRHPNENVIPVGYSDKSRNANNK